MFIKKKNRKLFHILRRVVPYDPTSDLKHWSLCGVPFYSREKSGDDFEIIENDDFKSGSPVCKKCYKKLTKNMTKGFEKLVDGFENYH